MAAPLSSGEEQAFAAIVAHFGDEERVKRRMALAAGSAVLAVSIPVLAFLLRWPWAMVGSFAGTFTLGMVLGQAVITRRPRPVSARSPRRPGKVRH